MKKWFHFFLFLSFGFLCIVLYKQGYLEIPTIHAPVMFVGSLLLILGGFACDAKGWQMLVNDIDRTQHSFGRCFASVGYSIFGKYIPGKVWLLIGRAGYIAMKSKGQKASDLSVTVIHMQLVALWSGCIVAILGLAGLAGLETRIVPMGFLFLGISYLIFFSHGQRLAESLIKKVLRKDLKLLDISLGATLRAAACYLVYWMIFSVAFYFFAQSISTQSLDILIGPTFVVGNIIGLLVIIAPGGIGAREGILVLLIAGTGLALDQATTISVASRFWFLLCEALLFVTALVVARNDRSVEDVS